MSPPEKINILVVDDLPCKLLALETVLAGLGENVVTARSGREALRRLLEQEFAVILLDVNMPDMDGFETASLIRRRKKTEHTPIIFVTAFDDEKRLAQGYSLGAVDYIMSPVVPAVLRTKVGVFVDLFRMRRQIEQQAEERVALAAEQAARAAAEEEARRLAFLAEAGSALGQSLDAAAVLRAPGRAGRAVPGRCGDRRPRRAGRRLASGDGRRRNGRRRGRDAPSGHYGGKMILPGGPGPAAAAVPLRARGRVLGALALAFGPSGRRYAAADLTLAEDLAGRAAAALENARLYRDIQEQDHRKTEFLAMLAHELRNPLAPMHNAVQILRRGAA